MPDIGETVWHLVGGAWIRDWCCQKLVVIGQTDEGEPITESGVVMWGVTKRRYQDREDVWKR